MTSLSTTTRREFLLEASLSGVAVSALAGDVFASQQSATATGLPTACSGPDSRARLDSLSGRLAHRIGEGSIRRDPDHAHRG